MFMQSTTHSLATITLHTVLFPSDLLQHETRDPSSLEHIRVGLPLHSSIRRVGPTAAQLLTAPPDPFPTEMATPVTAVTRRAAAAAAVVGAFVADAATMGLHWIYDGGKMAALVGARAAPEFYEPPSCPFYSYESGALSPYGDEVFPLLELVATTGTFDAAAFGDASYRAAKAYPGRLNHVFKELVAKGDAGKRYPDLASESVDLHGATKVPVLVARYRDAELPELLDIVRTATRVHQIGTEAEDAAVAVAVLLRQVISGVDIPTAVRGLAVDENIGASTRDNVQQVLDAVDAKRFPDATAAVGEFGKACPLPGSLQGSLFVLLTSTGGYADALRANMIAGGDNCSRAIVIGAVASAAAAAKEGCADPPVPEEWTGKTTRYAEVKALAQKLVQ